MEEFAASLGSKIVLPLDVVEDAQIDEVMAELQKQWGLYTHMTPWSPGDVPPENVKAWHSARGADRGLQHV